MQNTVYRNGSLWCTHTVFLPAGGPATRSAVQWWQLSPTGDVLQHGRIDDPTGSVFYAYPSLAVNKDNDVLIGYSRFSAAEYASAAYSFRAAAPPASSGSFRDRWGTWWGRIVPPVITPPPVAPDTLRFVDAFAAPSGRVIVEVRLHATHEVSGLQFTIQPTRDGTLTTDASFAGMINNLESAGFTTSFSTDANGATTVLLFSISGDTIQPGQYTLLYLVYTIHPETDPGTETAHRLQPCPVVIRPAGAPARAGGGDDPHRESGGCGRRSIRRGGRPECAGAERGKRRVLVSPHHQHGIQSDTSDDVVAMSEKTLDRSRHSIYYPCTDYGLGPGLY